MHLKRQGGDGAGAGAEGGEQEGPGVEEEVAEGEEGDVAGDSP